MRPVAVAPQFRWNLLPAAPGLRDRLAAGLGLGPLAAQVLLNRGVTDAAAARSMLPPTLAGMPDPLRVPGCAAAVQVLLRGAERGARVLVHGDYDVDGTCGSVLLHGLLTRLGMEVEVFVPDRVKDGYSFGVRSLEHIEAFGASIVISVDNGTTAVDALAELKRRGLEVVVVDHHLPGPVLPECSALMNPWLADPGDPDPLFPHFCGAAVAWLLAWAVLRERHPDGLPEGERRFLFDALGLAAIATIGDVMPLRGPNRALVQRGLESMPENSMPGLRALCAAAGVRGAPSAEDVAFRIAPRLNAAGRMHRAELAFQTLAARGAREAEQLCAQLEALNLERREVQERERQRFEVEAELQHQRGDGVLFAGDREAQFGVLGVVANQLMEAYGLPTLLWAECTPGVARGSARAPEGHDLTRILAAADAELAGYGGHARAAGFHFDPARADALAEALRAAAAAAPPVDSRPQLEVDAEVQPGEIDLRTLLELQRLEPYGEGFPAPLFLCAGARLAAAPRRIGDGTHAELRLEKEGEVVRALGWRMGDRLGGLGVGERVDVVVSAGINEFRGRRSVEWTLRDLRSSGA